LKRAALLLALASCGSPPSRPAELPAGPRLVPGAHVASLEGGALAYHVAGPGKAGAPVCVVWPGGPGIDSAYLRGSPLERDLTLVYVDPVGTGASARLADPGGYQRARYVGDLEKLRAALGLERVCLIGHSYGGFVALSYALAHPGRVSHLVLYDSAARLDADLRRAAAAGLERLRDRRWFAEVAAGFAATPVNDDEATRILARIAPAYVADWETRGGELGPALARSRAHAAPMTAEERAPYDVRTLLPALKVPTLVLVGRHDFVCPLAFAEELASGIPGAKLVVFERSGHMAHLEEPEEFRGAVAGFVR
jgi:proline iminopeptidase